jgi:DNA-binding MarR family transcriptional regulator
MSFYSEACFDPDNSIGYLVRRANQLGAAALEPVFADHGLTYTQWQALVSIWFGRGMTAADLARDLGHDKGATTRLVDMLSDKGWITREPSPDDRRRIALALTDAGEAVTLACKKDVVGCWNRWLSDWPEEDARTLILLLQRLRATLVEAGPCA